jgi:hypothetical protein
MSTEWQADKERKRAERQQKQFDRAMAAPPPRAEIFSQTTQLFNQVSSVALAIESLETLLIAKGVLKDNELMESIESLVRAKSEQVQAADCVAQEKPLVTLAS